MSFCPGGRLFMFPPTSSRLFNRLVAQHIMNRQRRKGDREYRCPSLCKLRVITIFVAMHDPPVEISRSQLMSRVRGRDTKPELVVRRLLHASGSRFRLHRRDLPGTPDVVLPRYRLAIFVHGCFWHRHHGCSKTTTPKTRAAFWNDKFDRNVARDQLNLRRLEASGWRHAIIWECETKDVTLLRARLTTLLASVSAPGD
jgi:DNA mismatch endonuclease (patch repair protein)